MTDLSRPTLAEAVQFADAGRGTLTVERRAIVWRYLDERGRGRTETWGAFASNDKARAAIAAARARVHLNPSEAA